VRNINLWKRNEEQNGDIKGFWKHVVLGWVGWGSEKEKDDS
jgi:hypothetical protein